MPVRRQRPEGEDSRPDTSAGRALRDPRTQDARDLPESAEVVIVGAGAAGLYCAWRLLEQGRAEDVVIVERLNRIGGRLDTDLIKIDRSTVRDEEGGMRFNYHMNELMALFGALGLCDQIVPFPMGPIDRGFGLHYFMRGEAFSDAEASANDNAKWAEIYKLGPKEKGKSPVEIVSEVYQAILDANTSVKPPWPKAPTPDDWQRFRLEYQWNGRKLNEWQLWGLIRDMGYSEEAVTMLSHAIGFEGPFLSLANAGEAFQILEDFPENPQYFTFRDGYSTLTEKLLDRVVGLGGRVFLGVNVDRISAGSTLETTVAPPDQSSSRFVRGGETRQLNAREVILAIASKALADLYATSPVLHGAPNAEQIWDDIQSVENLRLLKINLYFDESWWEDGNTVKPPVQYGPSFTDLPINSIYPFYSLAGPEDKVRPGALTIYCDFNNTNFWQGLQNLEPFFDSPLQREHTAPPQVLFPASVAVVEEALKQIQQLFGAAEVPWPVLTSYRLWGGESDFGFAYHQWALNADDRQVMKRLAEPVPGIYTCNEAYSDDQGWVNGSLRSADIALRCFHIEPLVDDPGHATCKPPSTSD